MTGLTDRNRPARQGQGDEERNYDRARIAQAAPEEIEEGEIIAFMRNSSVVTHRVEENRFVEGEFITKGDANSKEDVMPVDYESLIGRVACHIPALGILLSVLASGVGKLYAAGFRVISCPGSFGSPGSL